MLCANDKTLSQFAFRIRSAFLVLILTVGCSCGSSAPDADFDPNAYQIATTELVAVSSTHACAISRDNDLSCWGNDQFGESTASGESGEDQLLPYRILTGQKFKFVAATGHATFAIGLDGSLWSWGDDAYGQRGIGLPANVSVSYEPRQIGTDSDWKLVRGAGDNHGACAIKEDGSLWCWGDNRDSQLGIGGATGFETGPTRVGSDSDWLDVDLSTSSTCAVKLNQTLWCWGNSPAFESNTDESGMFTGASTGDPRQALEGHKIRSMNMGGGNGCALTTGGELYCWGSNDGGQLLGLEPLAKFHGPTKIASETSWKQVVASSTICVLDTDNRVSCWGANNGGCLGRGVSQNELRFSQDVTLIATEQRFTSLFGSTFTLFAQTETGALYGWGRGTYGKLGNGNGADQESLVSIAID